MEIPRNKTDGNPDMVVGGERVNQQVKGGVCEIVVRAKEENQDGGRGGHFQHGGQKASLRK